MGYYYNLRGWLEVDDADLPHVRSHIETKQKTLNATSTEQDRTRALYMGGWVFPSNIINATSYVFYGADVRLIGVELMEIVLREIMAICLISGGFFHAQSEDQGDNRSFIILDNNLRMAQCGPLFTYGLADSHDHMN